jgi:hypothetical protein
MTGYVAKDLPADLDSRPLLSKPVDPNRLLSCVGEMLAARGFAPVTSRS